MILRVEGKKNFSFTFSCICVEVSKIFKYEFISKPTKMNSIGQFKGVLLVKMRRFCFLMTMLVVLMSVQHCHLAHFVSDTAKTMNS